MGLESLAVSLSEKYKDELEKTRRKELVKEVRKNVERAIENYYKMEVSPFIIKMKKIFNFIDASYSDTKLTIDRFSKLGNYEKNVKQNNDWVQMDIKVESNKDKELVINFYKREVINKEIKNIYPTNISNNLLGSADCNSSLQELMVEVEKHFTKVASEYL